MLFRSGPRRSTGAHPLERSALSIANQVGDIRALLGGHLAPTPVLDLRGRVLYVDFTDPNGDTRVQEFTMHGDIADVGSRRELLFVRQPYPNHNGGEVLTGPDGMLYIGLGDGGSEGDPNNIGQNRATLLSKILRIDPRATATGPYSVPEPT